MKKRIFVNQLGYGARLPKTAVLLGGGTDFSLLSAASGRVVYNGQPNKKQPVFDAASGDEVRLADFSDFDIPGEYRLQWGIQRSEKFVIREHPYRELKNSLIRALYYSRCGCELDRDYLGEYYHSPCHTDFAITYEGKVPRDVSGGWHDAGDFGRYTVPTCTALGHMLYAYRIFPAAFGHERHPEGSDSLPDLLAECKHGLRWLMKIQNRDGGMPHKVTEKRFCGMILPEKDKSVQYILPPSHCATADSCSVFALASGIFKDIDKEFSEQLYLSAIRAWEWVISHRDYKPFKNPEGFETGLYSDEYYPDNYLWALCEMFDLTGDSELGAAIAEYAPQVNMTDFGWASVGGFAALCYLCSERDKDFAVAEKMKTALMYEADCITERSLKNGYGEGIENEKFIWGSNMEILNSGIVLLAANRLFPNESYVRAAAEQLNYILGKNPNGISFVTGFGKEYPRHPHHRAISADGIEEPFAGLIVGGADMGRSDECIKWLIPQGTPPAKCYVDNEYSFATNETAIYWITPAIFILGFFDGYAGL